MNIKVLGSGCANCKKLEKSTIQALNELGLSAEVDHVYDMGKILSYGVMRTPALVIDEKVVLQGRVPSGKELTDILSKQ